MSEIELDDTILISCPERGFILRKVKHCLDCEYYKGMVKHTDSDSGNVYETHHVLCGRPMTRSLTKMSAD